MTSAPVCENGIIRPSLGAIDTFEKLNLRKMQGIARCFADLLQMLDRSTWDARPVDDFWRVEAASLRRLAGSPLLPIPQPWRA